VVTENLGTGILFLGAKFAILVPRTERFFTTGDRPWPRPSLWPPYFIAPQRDKCAVTEFLVGAKLILRPTRAR
jgi:hypothetical protein